MSAVTSLLDAGVPKGKNMKKIADGNDDNNPVLTALKWRNTSNLNSFLDLQPDFKTSMGKLILKNHKTASKTRDEMINAIGFRDGHELSKHLTRDDTKSPDSSTCARNLQNPQHPEGPDTTPLEKPATRKAKGKTGNSSEEDCVTGSVSVASAPSESSGSSDATKDADPPLLTMILQAATQASVVQLLIQALEALQQPSAASSAPGTYYNIRVSVEDLGEWLAFKKQHKERRSDL